jgi:hypothetical protein
MVKPFLRTVKPVSLVSSPAISLSSVEYRHRHVRHGHAIQIYGDHSNPPNKKATGWCACGFANHNLFYVNLHQAHYDKARSLQRPCNSDSTVGSDLRSETPENS